MSVLYGGEHSAALLMRRSVLRVHWCMLLEVSHWAAALLVQAWVSKAVLFPQSGQAAACLTWVISGTIACTWKPSTTDSHHWRGSLGVACLMSRTCVVLVWSMKTKLLLLLLSLLRCRCCVHLILMNSALLIAEWWGVWSRSTSVGVSLVESSSYSSRWKVCWQ